MKQSGEIAELMARFYDAASRGDTGFLEGLVSRERLLWIGTDPEEWWEDAKAVFKAWQEQGGGVVVKGGDAKVFQQGDVAWVADRPICQLPDGRRFSFRITVVFSREPAGWRIAHVHSSYGIPNEEVAERVEPETGTE